MNFVFTEPFNTFKLHQIFDRVRGNIHRKLLSIPIPDSSDCIPDIHKHKFSLQNNNEYDQCTLVSGSIEL
jgi:hypothetical protein